MTLRSLALLAILLTIAPFFVWWGAFIMGGVVVADLFVRVLLGFYLLFAAAYILMGAGTIISHSDFIQKRFGGGS
jgi:hypothetical protein